MIEPIAPVAVVAPAAADAPELSFEVVDAMPTPGGAAPSLSFAVRVGAVDGAPVQSVLLRAQLRIQAPRRRYTPDEQTRLRELFGWPEQWSSSLQSLFWTTVTAVVPAFDGETTIQLIVPLTYDFDVVATKYLAALGDADVPLLFLFSGTCFRQTDRGLRATQIPWDHEAAYAMPPRMWRDAMDAQFPNTAWLRLRRDVFDRLVARRTERGLATWDQAIEELLDGAEGPAG